MLPQNIQWDCVTDDTASASASTDSSSVDSLSYSRRISSLSCFHGINNDESEDENYARNASTYYNGKKLCAPQHIMPALGYNLQDKENREDSPTQCRERQLDTQDLRKRSFSSLKVLLDQNYKPESRKEAFECLRCLDDWSTDPEKKSANCHVNAADAACNRMHGSQSYGLVEFQKEKKMKINMDSGIKRLVRKRSTDMRRTIFAGQRESSLIW
jgi:hypothetical protein